MIRSRHPIQYLYINSYIIQIRSRHPITSKRKNIRDEKKTKKNALLFVS